MTTLPKTMTACSITKQGDANDVFITETVAVPTLPDGDHVLIQVDSVSINPIEAKVRAGIPATPPPHETGILHGDCAGTIVAMGDNVTGYNLGDGVYTCGSGGLAGKPAGASAEYAVAHQNVIAPAPKALGTRNASALGTVAMTAWGCLYNFKNWQAGDTILVHGGCGGVGHVAVQLALRAGLIVHTTVSSQEKASIVSRWGAHPILYHDESAADYTQRITGGKGFKFIIDTVGTTALDDSMTALGMRGVIVGIAGRSTHDLTLLHNKSGTISMNFMAVDWKTEFCREALKTISQYCDDGTLEILIHKNRFALETMGPAHKAVEQGTLGKVVVDVT